MSAFQKFVEYFLYPTANPYTTEKIAVYLFFLLVAIVLIYKLLNKLNIKINRRFIAALLPLALFSGALRAMQDQGIVNSIFFVTPWIYVVYFAVAIALISFSILLAKFFRRDHTKFLFMSSLILFSISLSQFDFSFVFGLLIMLPVFLVWPVVLFAFKIDNEKNFIVSTHMFDSATNFIGESFFGFQEYYTSVIVGTAVGGWIFLIKFLGILALLFLIEKYVKDKNFANYLKLLIVVFALGPATRNVLNML